MPGAETVLLGAVGVAGVSAAAVVAAGASAVVAAGAAAVAAAAVVSTASAAGTGGLVAAGSAILLLLSLLKRLQEEVAWREVERELGRRTQHNTEAGARRCAGEV